MIEGFTSLAEAGFLSVSARALRFLSRSSTAEPTVTSADTSPLFIRRSGRRSSRTSIAGSDKKTTVLRPSIRMCSPHRVPQPHAARRGPSWRLPCSLREKMGEEMSVTQVCRSQPSAVLQGRRYRSLSRRVEAVFASLVESRTDRRGVTGRQYPRSHRSQSFRHLDPSVVFGDSGPKRRFVRQSAMVLAVRVRLLGTAPRRNRGGVSRAYCAWQYRNRLGIWA